MSIIGTFTPTKDGGYEGTIRTLTIDLKARFVPNDNRSSDSAPAFRVFAGRSEIGAAWKAHTDGEPARDYLSVRLEDPCLPSAIQAALFEDVEKRSAQLVWSRRRSDS
ncbi:MAG TPA: DUF736 domain-containing protein [Gemmatimonadaceae bacterium]|nr:DUF736 domain-containing protein [Gemmatimonadaceae bacterium]